ncbi:MAG: RNA polymerase sigma factor [Actinomycetota bacterium]|nr:RNA polymerase sigma factor [Actinomycetota bacterium]
MSEVDTLLPLLHAAREGDDRAVRELVSRTQPIVWRVCSVLGSPGEEEDLVQETYLRALRSFDSYRGDAPVRAWLLSIARHVCADHVRKRARQRRLHDRLSRVAGTDQAPDSEAIDQLLVALLPDQREAFELTQLVGLSYEEAADMMGCPVGTVRSRVARARVALVAAVRAAEAV